jgi:hypothetical protein
MNYQQKYLKYKNKYNELKYTLKGGDITDESMKYGVILINGSEQPHKLTDQRENIIKFIEYKIQEFIRLNGLEILSDTV